LKAGVEGVGWGSSEGTGRTVYSVLCSRSLQVGVTRGMVVWEGKDMNEMKTLGACRKGWVW
jgi:hypothetical protein